MSVRNPDIPIGIPDAIPGDRAGPWQRTARGRDRLDIDMDRYISRRRVLEGMGVSALGLAGAALIGCGGGGNQAGGGGVKTDPNATTIAGSTKGGGLPMQAPKVAGTPKRGGTWTTGITSTYKQHDAHTALATNIYHHIGDKGIEPHPVTNKLLPHILKSWEVADPTGTTLTATPWPIASSASRAKP